jgi:predicted acylesterase/phospholipase RssA
MSPTEVDNRIAAGQAVPFKELKGRVKTLKLEWEFAKARQLLQQARPLYPDPREYPWVVQQLALCTYKDEELLPATRFRLALELLEEIGLRDPVHPPKTVDPSTVPETLALGGGIYKRRWEHEGQLEHLHQALGFYLAAWRCSPSRDLGYGGANAACILDVLAWRTSVLARRTGSQPDSDLAREARRLQRKARVLRLSIVNQLPTLAAARVAANPDDDPSSTYFYEATLGELWFGLGDYVKAREHLAAARDLEAGPETSEGNWALQSTFHQLLGIARAQGIHPPEEEKPPSTWGLPWQVLFGFLGELASPALSSYRGRVGLALSGGGFRASYFHLGVLARLADVDALRGVEVLSTVSGGSIVGAHYYLLLRDLLQTKGDARIDRSDYVALVQRLCDDFHKGVERNIRMRTLSSLLVNFRMIVTRTYTRSARLGELYEQELYRGIGNDAVSGDEHRLEHMVVKPRESRGVTFKPKFENWIRRAKVPVLLLNATSLNSGHNWQFTARWMGEPPGLVGEEVDTITRYRRLWYDQAPTEALRNYPLGKAVAASSCVPGLFDPLVLDGLYPGRTVRLVDGGVHDNQGVGGLLNEGCTIILCSDASGQMADVERPGDSSWAVPLRCSTVLQGRVRVAQYQDLKGRLDSRSLKGLLFLHLRKGLESHPLDWTNCKAPSVLPESFSATTAYGVDKDLQQKLSELRTDLDSFSEVEARALMTSGYLMTEQQLNALNDAHHRDGEPGSWGDFNINAPRFNWGFLTPEFETLMRLPASDPDARRHDLERQLQVGHNVAFKIWRLSPALSATAITAAVVIAIAVVWAITRYWRTSVTATFDSSVGTIVLTIGLMAAALVFPVLKMLQPMEALRGYVSKAALAFLGWIAANVHLAVFDRMFKRRGRMERLLKLP